MREVSQPYRASGILFSCLNTNCPMPSLKDQPRGATLARDAMSGDVEKPQESSLGVDLGTTGLQSGGVTVENPFGDSLANTGLQ